MNNIQRQFDNTIKGPVYTLDGFPIAQNYNKVITDGARWYLQVPITCMLLENFIDEAETWKTDTATYYTFRGVEIIRSRTLQEPFKPNFYYIKITNITLMPD